MSREENDGSEQPTSSDPEHFLYLMRKIEECERRLNILEGEMPLMVTNTVRQEIKPAVREEFQKLLTERTRNEVAEERSLYLKFLHEVSGPVQTSKEFRAVTDGPLKVALFDATGNIVNSGPESSAEVEILLIDATGNGKECATTNEDFERTIIRTGDKKKPHFAKNVYVNLDNGVGSLTNQKLGQGSDWTKNWTCRLVARFVKNFGGLKVQKAWTSPFKVIDNRGELYKKHETPFPHSEVWRVKEIGRAGGPRKHLESKLIKTVLDLLFWLTVNPKGLQEITKAGDKRWKTTKAGDKRWKTMVAHARTCKIDDKKMYHHISSTEPHTGVIYDCVGELKGVIDESHFVPIDNLSADEKDHACKLLSLVLEPSAFVDRYNTSYNDEASLVQEYPYKSSNLNSSTICSIQQFSNGFASENINGFQTAEPGCSSQSITPYIMTPDLHHNTINPSMDTNNLIVRFPLSSSSQSIYQSGSVESPGTRQLNESIHLDALLFPRCQFSDLENISMYDPTGEGTSSQGMIFGLCSPGSPTTGLLHEANIVVESLSPTFLLNPNTNGLSETLSHDRSTAFRLVGRVVNATLWVVRAKKRKRVMGLGDDGMNGVEPRTLSEIFEADPNDMDPVQLNGGCQTSYEHNKAWIEELQFVDEYIQIEMSNGDDERAAAAVVNASIRWKQLFCVVTWTFSSSRRVLSVSVGHPPKRKKQRVG